MRSNAVEGTTFGTKTYLAPMLANECSQEIPLHAQIHETRGLLDHNTEVATGEHQVSQMVTSMEEKNMRNIVDIKVINFTRTLCYKLINQCEDFQ